MHYGRVRVRSKGWQRLVAEVISAHRISLAGTNGYTE